jgi:hypothetical protein
VEQAPAAQSILISGASAGFRMLLSFMSRTWREKMQNFGKGIVS